MMAFQRTIANATGRTTSPCGCLYSSTLNVGRVFSAKHSLLRGSQAGLQHDRRHSSATVMSKEGLHPEYFDEAKVYCNGEEVLTTSGTREKYTVDIWSGNHPFFQGSNSTVMLDEGRVNKFNRRFSGLEGTYGKVGTSGGKKLDMSKITMGKKDKKKKKR